MGKSMEWYVHKGVRDERDDWGLWRWRRLARSFALVGLWRQAS